MAMQNYIAPAAEQKKEDETCIYANTYTYISDYIYR